MDFNKSYYTRTDNLVASIFMMWSDVLWPRSKSNGLLRLGALDMSTEAFDLMLLGEFFRWNRSVFREFMGIGGYVYAHTIGGSSKHVLTIDGKKTARHFYVYQRGVDQRGLESNVEKLEMNLCVEMSATEDMDGTVRVDHVWSSVPLYCQEYERCHGVLRTHLSWKSNKIEFVTI